MGETVLSSDSVTFGLPIPLVRIRGVYDTLPRSERKVADYVLNYADEVIYSSVTDLAQTVDVSESTVVRFCQRLGYQGYPELRSELADSIVKEKDVISGADLIPLLQGQREALEAEKEHIQQMVDKIDAEIEWIGKIVEKCM